MVLVCYLYEFIYLFVNIPSEDVSEAYHIIPLVRQGK
jgi:hypothetical protein